MYAGAQRAHSRDVPASAQLAAAAARGLRQSKRQWDAIPGSLRRPLLETVAILYRGPVVKSTRNVLIRLPPIRSRVKRIPEHISS